MGASHPSTVTRTERTALVKRTKGFESHRASDQTIERIRTCGRTVGSHPYRIEQAQVGLGGLIMIALAKVD